MMDLEQVNTADLLNVFIEFQIILDSKLEDITQELDVLISAGKQIYLWSKTYRPEQIRKYCYEQIIDVPNNEKELHKKVLELRNERKTYTEISEVLKIAPERVGYFMSVNINKVWRLSDWIKDYYIKDSSFYEKVDIIIDPDPRFVNRFIKCGKYARVVDKI